jgi:mannobiose 2-epimerase
MIMKKNFDQLKKEFSQELTDGILNYWEDNVYDKKRKTFYGRIDINEKKYPDASLSAVFTTRIMWTYSAAYRFFPNVKYKLLADTAYRILADHFWDKENGGIYWRIKPDGTPVDGDKQFYAQAFFIYALSEYNLAFNDEKVLEIGQNMFELMEKHAFDSKYGGYFEARTADWKETNNQRMSPNDEDIKKTMNTHLHILEAFTNLYRVWKDEKLEKQLEHLIRIFLDKILNRETHHFHLFFDDDWTVRSSIDSYGHDIEGSWLLCEAAEVLGKKDLLEEVEHNALMMAEVALQEGMHSSGGMFYEKEGDHLEDRFSWWTQAEAVVGFFNAWQLSKKEKYLDQAKKTWEFIKKYNVDKRDGGWYATVSSDLKVVPTDKVSGWKAPYHNARMCMEMMRRLEMEQ